MRPRQNTIGRDRRGAIDNAVEKRENIRLAYLRQAAPMPWRELLAEHALDLMRGAAELAETTDYHS